MNMYIYYYTLGVLQGDLLSIYLYIVFDEMKKMSKKRSSLEKAVMITEKFFFRFIFLECQFFINIKVNIIFLNFFNTICFLYDFIVSIKRSSATCDNILKKMFLSL